MENFFAWSCKTFQEGSKDHYSLLDLIVDFKLRARGLARGMEGSEQERSIILLNLRRELSTAGAKAQSDCILGRVARLGEGHRQAARIRVWVRREEEMREGDHHGRRGVYFPVKKVINSRKSLLKTF